MLNKKSTSLWLLVCFWMCVLASAPASAQEQPQTQPGDPPKAPFVRQGIYDKPFMIKGFGTSVGGYGDIHWRFLRTEGVTDSLTFSPERFNLFTYTPVGDRVRVALELEIEEGGQEIKLELAIIDFEIHEALTFRAGMLLCLEAMLPELARDAARDGADVLVNLSNDAWFGRREAAELQLDVATLRAVENRRYLVRAAATGISAVIDPHGRTVVRGGFGTEEALDATVRPSITWTPWQHRGAEDASSCRSPVKTIDCVGGLDATVPFLGR